MSPAEEPTPIRLREVLPGVVAVAATYVTFLLHAQFGFLALAEDRLGDAHDLKVTMTVMGLTGLIVSLGAGAMLRRAISLRFLSAAFGFCAVAALVPLACQGRVAFALAAALVGASIGFLTVFLATRLRELLPLRRMGLLVGIGTGSAYFIANLPATFHGGPIVQAVVPAACCIVAGVLVWFRPASKGSQDGVASRALAAMDCARLGFASLVAGFLALVWLDSAAFWIIQETVALKGQTWGEGSQTLVQGSAHLVAAVVAGWLIDRGLLRSLLVATFVIFTTAFALLQGGGLPVTIAGPLYAFGISIYSTALVVVPSLGPRGQGLVAVRWRAAVLYAVAGWLGSALGIGMGQDLHRIPIAFSLAAGAVLFLGALAARPARLRLALAAFGPGVVLALLVMPLSLPTLKEGGDAVGRGRRVYLAEGCINCHSQYVRPGTADVAAWGPYRADHLSEAPPLLGLRRNGPDLLNVGNRRGTAWQRLHLIDPRALVPGSRMPSYGPLFDDERGDDLVAYLTSLGAGSSREQLPPTAAVLAAADLELGRRVFADACASCHGEEGRGDGVFSGAFGGPFLDLHVPGLPLVPRATGDEARDLAAVVRWGLPGGRMPGHELLTDEELASVVAWVGALRSTPNAKRGLDG